VGWNGQAIVFPGRSLTGKTTLVAELVRAGATYYSDEYAVLDADGRVYPFPRPLAVRKNGNGHGVKVSVEELGGKRGVKSLPVGLVVMTEYKPGAQWRPRRLSPGLGALALLDNTVAAQQTPEKALDTIQQIVPRAQILKGTRGEAREATELILDKLRNSRYS
jgi:hypothetical protein